MSIPPKTPTVLPIRPVDRPVKPQPKGTWPGDGSHTHTLATKKLTFKQAKFVQELLADPDRIVAKAAMRAGYSELYAYTVGHDLVTHPAVAKAIEEADRKALRKLTVSHERILKELATIAFSNVFDYMSEDPSSPGSYRVDLSKVPVRMMGAIKDITEERYGQASRVKITLHDKLSALTLLGKHMNMFKESSELVTKDGKRVLTVNELDNIIEGKTTVEELDRPRLGSGSDNGGGHVN